MYLKSLQLHGFKSFAEKTNLEFNNGITVVVGPNGSGKSNISDAVRWVLGEQSAKSLRGSKMEDVIFTGTQARRQQGFAEVSLIVDNSDKQLPIDYNEVVITRRVFRSGESEYLINNSSCRLKDIYELFLDSGVGRDSYSIIGQGKIDSILSSKSEDRRSIFEEASGIMKYKVRKIEAERKLEHTEQNLLRINDILNELNAQLVPLKSQSEKAKKFIEYRDQLRDVEVNLMLHNIDKFHMKVDEFNELLKAQHDDSNAQKELLNKITFESKEKTDKLKEYEILLNNLQAEFYNNEKEIERKTSDVKINDQKLINIRVNIERFESEIKSHHEYIGTLDVSGTELEGALAELKAQKNVAEENLNKATADYEDFLTVLEDSASKIEQTKDLLMRKMELLSEIKFQSSNAIIEMKSMSKRQVEIETEISQNQIEIDKEVKNSNDLKDNVFMAKNNLDKTKSSLDELYFVAEQDNDQLKSAKSSFDLLNSELSVKSSKLKLLKNMDDNLEGYKRSVKEILGKKRVDKSFGNGVHGAFAQLIKVPSKFQVAIESALGNIMQNIVVNNENDAKDCISFLKKKSVGRCTFLPISTVKEKFLNEDVLSELSDTNGFIDIASNIAVADRIYDGIVGSTLGRIVIVDTYDNAVKIARQFKYKLKLVTLNGEVFNPGGSISGGVELRETGLISRKGEIKELTDDITKIQADIKDTSSKIDSLTKTIEINQAEVDNLEKVAKNYELEILRDENHLLQIEQYIIRLQDKNNLLTEELTAIAEKSDKESTTTQQFASQIEIIEDEISKIKESIENEQLEYSKKAEEREKYTDLIANFRVQIAGFEENVNNLTEKFESATVRKQEISAEIQNKIQLLEQQKQFLEQVSEGSKDISAEIAQLTEHNIKIKIELEQLTIQKSEFENNMSETIEKINSINQNIVILQDEINKIEIRKSKVENDLEAIHAKLWEEYELTETTASEYRKEIDNYSVVNKEVSTLKNLIKGLGTINVAAIEDYVATKERVDFMTNQSNDLIETKKKLNKIIREMMEIMQEQFISQFKAINKNFNEVFKELFNGGRAELKLADESDILASGIDIIVQPPGKKLQNMMLLSGGEKAMTAIALLFAILKNRATPFCILDEIEAALDEANVHRFGQYLKNFSKETQFIVVTHRKGTMEVADALYGVTMQEHGVSNMVSLKLS